VSPLVVFSPAKLNLFLAITGRRNDGFHDLVSVVAPLGWGDTLRAEAAGEFSIACDAPAVPRDETNLILKAATAFRSVTGWRGGARFVLEKRIPIGAGLGGGSSNGVAALRALNKMAGEPLGPAQLAEIAAQLGSDCPLFLYDVSALLARRSRPSSPVHGTAAARRRCVLAVGPDCRRRRCLPALVI
jgi:4-diphosphocytidyl-2-C-methyl-D-erythritol kinase